MLANAIFKSLLPLTAGVVEKSGVDLILEDEERPVQAFAFSKLVSLDSNSLKFPGFTDPASSLVNVARIVELKSPGSVRIE